MWPVSTHKALSSVLSPAEAGSTAKSGMSAAGTGSVTVPHAGWGAAVTVEAVFFELSTKYLKLGSEMKFAHPHGQV